MNPFLLGFTTAAAVIGLPLAIMVDILRKRVEENRRTAEECVAMLREVEHRAEELAGVLRKHHATIYADVPPEEYMTGFSATIAKDKPIEMISTPRGRHPFIGYRPPVPGAYDDALDLLDERDSH